MDDLTHEELAWMNGPGKEGRYEWVDGRPVKKPGRYIASVTAAHVVAALVGYDRPGRTVAVLAGQEYQCFPGKPTQVRKPDVSLILTRRVPVPHPTGFLRFVPDLAVDFTPPADSAYDLDAKLEDYRSAGFPLVWTVNPDSRIVRVHALGQPVVEVRPGETLRAQGLLPGFAVAIDALVPAAVAAA